MSQRKCDLCSVAVSNCPALTKDISVEFLGMSREELCEVITKPLADETTD